MKDYKHWSIHKVNKTDDGLIVSIELRNEDNTISLGAKWDGCVNLFKYYNGFTCESEYSQEVEDNSDYIHICNLPEFIKQLQEVLTIAKDILGEEKYERDFA